MLHAWPFLNAQIVPETESREDLAASPVLFTSSGGDRSANANASAISGRSSLRARWTIKNQIASRPSTLYLFHDL